MLTREGFLNDAFLRWFPYEPTPCQYALLQKVASFLTSDDGDILVVNGYAGTGKTAALASVINALTDLEVKCVLLAPTGRSAKVLSSYAGRPASTIHKHIYRQKSFGSDGFGQFSLMPNKSRNTLFIVDEVSLIGIEAGEKGLAFGSGNLLEDLVAFVRSGVDCRLILVGDNAQLPPVGLDASPALSPEYMAGIGGVSFATLTSVVRQGEGSGILVNATRLREKLALGEDPIGLDELGLVTKGFPDIESITGKMYTEGSTGEIKGDDIDEFIKLMRDADYKRSDRSDHYASVICFEFKYKDGKEQQISVVGSYGSSDDNDSGELTLYKGFVKIDDGDYYECDTKKIFELFLKNSNSKYKE